MRTLFTACFFGLAACSPSTGADTLVANETESSSDTAPAQKKALPKTAPAKPSAMAGPVTGEFKTSEIRQGTKVLFAYDQPLGGVYSSSWWIAADAANGDWRDVYYETNEKLTYSGIVSFRCDGSSDIGVLNYGAEWGNADAKRVYVVKPNERQHWKSESRNESWGDDLPPLPYQVVESARMKFC
jgi:hypothetical protein